jgi:hypothetical protein
LNRFLGLPLDTLKLLFSNIDINLTVSLIEANYAKNGRGRRRFPVRSMLLALMFMRLNPYLLVLTFMKAYSRRGGKVSLVITCKPLFEPGL